jgi:replicative DNA helicase
MEAMEQYHFEAEAALVGAFFLDPELVKECTIRPEQLYTRKLRLIFSAIRSLDEKGKPIDVIAVVEEIGFETIEAVGGISFITQLAASVPTTANFHYYEKAVKEYDQKRKAVQIAGKIIKQAKNTDISKTLSDGIQDLMRIEDEQTDEDTGDIQNTLVDLYLDCEQDHGEIVGIPSGFSQLDRLTGGFQESDLIIIGARPSVGKTAFALNIALNASKDDISLIFSLEMSKQQLLKRMTGSTGKIDSLKMRNPKREFQEEDWENFSEAIGKISKANILFLIVPLWMYRIFGRKCVKCDEFTVRRKD